MNKEDSDFFVFDGDLLYCTGVLLPQMMEFEYFYGKKYVCF